MKPIYLLIYLISITQSVKNSLLKNNLKKEKGFENVEIIHKMSSITPEYVKEVDKNEMKTATLINTVKNENNSRGLTERPNFLSPVITRFETKVSTPSHIYNIDKDSLTYDLDSISK